MESSRRSDNIVYIGGKSLVLVVCTPFSFKGSRSHLLARFFCKINIWVDKEEKYGSLKTTNFREKSPKTLSTWVFFGWKDTRLLCNWSTRALDKSPWSYGRVSRGQVIKNIAPDELVELYYILKKTLTTSSTCQFSALKHIENVGVVPICEVQHLKILWQAFVFRI